MDLDVHMGSPPKRRRIDLSAQNATVYTSAINPLNTPVTRLTDLPFSSPTRFSAALPQPADPISQFDDIIHSPQSEEGDTLEDMRVPKAQARAGLLGIEDISDSQWHEAEASREKRMGSRSSGEILSSSNRNIPSSMTSPRPHLVVDLSDSPTQVSIKTPRATSPQDPESQPIEWPTSPIRAPKRHKLVSDSEEDEQTAGPSAQKRTSPTKKRKIISSPSPEVQADTNSGAAQQREEKADEMNPEEDTTAIMGTDSGLDVADWQAAAAAFGTEHGPSLDDLFADDENEPPRRDSRPGNEFVDLVNDDDDDYDWGNFPMPDLDDLAIPGPSTTITHQDTAKDAAPGSSPRNPPALLHPIMLISDMPPDVQDFYRNHWRRGANKATPKRRTSYKGDDMSGSEEEGFGVKMPARAPPNRGRGRGGWGFRGRGRGRARGRGRGR